MNNAEDLAGRIGGKAPPLSAPSQLHPPLLLFPARNSNAFTGARETSERGKEENSRSLLLLTNSPGRGEELHMYTQGIATNQFLKHDTFFLSLGTYHTLFWIFVSFVSNWHLSQKKPHRCSALLLPFHWRLPERERDRERETEREKARGHEKERVGQKAQ